MTYSFTKPDGGPSPNIDVVQIQTNFAQFASIFSSSSGGVNYNHTALNNPNQGDHESIILTNQSADPGVTLDLAVLYCKNVTNTIGTQPQLFVQIPQFLPTSADTTAAPNTPMQLTYGTVNNSGPMYQSFLPGGYVLYWGSVTSVTATVTLSPAPSKILTVLATPNNVSGSGNQNPFTVSTAIQNATTFKIYSNATLSFTISWFAIGVQ